ncbi:hypothetical protein H0H81_006397 [Sphagnurus paluster]|uniref:Uncharacterized protein n=1 Tax=Sphagnurus paluster TaxID=117069 RepID=A0A9P7FZC4_9AGAR|nr:hypothetical protein H0H81_006397 [Sphagnurus paluster]
MAKPTMLQSLLGRPSQTYSFPQERVYFSTKQDMLRIAAETHGRVEAETIGERDELRFKPKTGLPDSQVPNADVDDDDDDDSEHDVFYTPNTSPRTSMVSTGAGPAKAASPTGAAVRSTKTSFTHVNTSTTSISSSALDAHSLFSLSHSHSTRMTSPAQSDSDHPPRRPKPKPPQLALANGHASQDWAKDVRWLVPVPGTAKSTTTPRKPKPDAPQTRTKPNTPMSKSISKMTPSIMTSMAALLEEDEETPNMVHHPRSTVLISTPRRRGSISSSRAKPTLHHRRSRSLGHGSSSHSSTHASSSSSRHTASSSTSHTPKPSKYASSSADPYDHTTTPLPTFTPGDLPSHGTRGYTSLVLPRAPVPLSQTSHHPRGLFSAKDTPTMPELDGKVDLTRSGVAQTTMASVEVVRGLSAAPATPTTSKLISLFRRGSHSSPAPPSQSQSQSRPRGHSEDTGTGLAKARELLLSETPDRPLGFTSYRAPPRYVPSGSVLVQVWAVGVDGIDWRLVFGSANSHGKSSAGPSRANSRGTPPVTPPKRSVSFRSTLRLPLGGAGQRSGSGSAPALGSPETSSPPPPPQTSVTPAAGVGYIPGRSFVGRILECGWEVGEEIGRKGDWVVGMLDLKKCGALTEFIVVDRHRVHRAPYPRMQQDGFASLHRAEEPTTPSLTDSDNTPGPSRPNSRPSPSKQGYPSRIPRPREHLPDALSIDNPPNRNHRHRTALHPTPGIGVPLSLEELALLPACGIPAYRAVRTFAFAFSHSGGAGSTSNSNSSSSTGTGGGEKAKEEGRRALVLRGHDGAGALAVQMLVRRGWRVCVHVPFACLARESAHSAPPDPDPDLNLDVAMAMDARARVEHCMRRVEERVRAWGGEEVIFDDGEDECGGGGGAVVRVIERLCEDGDVFDAVLDTVGGKEVREAAERLLRSPGVGTGTGKRTGIGVKQFTTLVGDAPGRAIPSAGDNFKAGLRSLNFGRGDGDGKKVDGKVGYAWVSHAQDVDWEGENVRETLGAVMKTFMEEGVRPWVGDHGAAARVVPFEKAPGVFSGAERGLLTDGGTVVVKVVG